MTPEHRAQKITWGSNPLPRETQALIVAVIREAVAEERERCAKIVDCYKDECENEFHLGEITSRIANVVRGVLDPDD